MPFCAVMMRVDVAQKADYIIMKVKLSRRGTGGLTMAEYISREAVISLLSGDYIRDVRTNKGVVRLHTAEINVDKLMQLPTVNAQVIVGTLNVIPLKKADMWFCPQCKHACSTTQNYCHKCGIKFDWSEAKND